MNRSKRLDLLTEVFADHDGMHFTYRPLYAIAGQQPQTTLTRLRPNEKNYFILLLVCFGTSLTEKSEAKKNILLIAVDDLNDWVGVLGGHPQAKTPHIDKLAARGVLFTNANCQSPVCNPSRASMMTSRYPNSTGIYFLNPELSHSKEARKSQVLPQRFKQEGYFVAAAGKLFSP